MSSVWQTSQGNRIWPERFGAGTCPSVRGKEAREKWDWVFPILSHRVPFFPIPEADSKLN